jgi:uncharacterized membrane protein
MTTFRLPDVNLVHLGADWSILMGPVIYILMGPVIYILMGPVIYISFAIVGTLHGPARGQLKALASIHSLSLLTCLPDGH